jgi:hypothetical protein
VDAEKQITSFIISEELGTLAGYPATSESSTNNEKVFTNLNYKSKVFKSFKTFNLGLSFGVYPGQSDYDLTETLYDSIDPFIVWLCGGKRGATSFRFTKMGFGLNDIFHMQTVGEQNATYESGVYINAINQDMQFVEAE